MKKLALISTLLLVLPFVAGAQAGQLQPIGQLIVSAGSLIGLLIPIAIGAAMLVFFWGLIKYIRKPEDKNGKKTMIVGLIALFIMVSVWGIIRFAQTSLLGTTQTTAVPAPTVPK